MINMTKTIEQLTHEYEMTSDYEQQVEDEIADSMLKWELERHVASGAIQAMFPTLFR